MNEKRTRKDWIKNVAIIFLAIMLVLTFFSNTIMNYSLPEVAVKYVESGSITAKIRGTGTVESGDPYYVTIPQQRNVEAVMVRVGDVVEKGQILYVIDATSMDSEVSSAENSLVRAQENLQTAREDYNEAVGKVSGNTYKSTKTGYIKNLMISEGDKVQQSLYHC